jgi:hypothetical protein
LAKSHLLPRCNLLVVSFFLSQHLYDRLVEIEKVAGAGEEMTLDVFIGGLSKTIRPLAVIPIAFNVALQELIA